jgi:anti-sigma factor RsiW
MSCDLHPEKLRAYADESLSPEELADVENHLGTCPSCAAEALAMIQMKRATRAAAANLTLQPEFRMRPEFRLQLQQSVRRPLWKPAWKPAWMPALAALAALLLLAIAGTAVMFNRHAAQNQSLAEALDLHVATLASPNPVDVISTDRHTVKPWFQGKLPFAFNLPELQDSPFRLIGGKLVYLERSPGAQLLFELRKHEISVFIAQEQHPILPFSTAVTATSEKGFSVESWNQSGLRYVVVSDTTPSDVHALGDLLRSAAR